MQHCPSPITEVVIGRRMGSLSLMACAMPHRPLGLQPSRQSSPATRKQGSCGAPDDAFLPTMHLCLCLPTFGYQQDRDASILERMGSRESMEDGLSSIERRRDDIVVPQAEVLAGGARK